MRNGSRAFFGVMAVSFVCVTACRGQFPTKGTAIGAENLDLEAMPAMLDGFSVNLFVKEPHIINPAALCFDKHGRLYVGAGPQYRGPKADSPKDYVKILIDADGDGVAETVKTFAEGFNCIESLAWRGDELWIANSPDLTVVRDTDEDGVADEYQMIYTGLNNLRHGLHGLNWGPDGWLYMTIGNTWVEDNAPLPFRQLQRNKSTDKTVYPLTKVYTKDTYKKSFHSLKKRETEGGMLRCRPGGHDLEIFARGMRNPWDACFDSSFNWLATDNDPGPQHDRIFMPVQYGHYTYRHPWVFDWNGKSPAVAPITKLFEHVSGSGTGVEFYTAEHFPAAYRNRYLIADWTNAEISFYKPKWDGAHQVPDGEMVKIADGGRNKVGDLKYEAGKGRSLFRPTDVKVGPAGDVYIGGWGSEYGTAYVPASKWTPEENAKYQGRVFRVRHKNPLISRKDWYPKKREKPLAKWSVSDLVADLGEYIEVWRVDAQDELVRRGSKVRKALLKEIDSGKQTVASQTWTIWTLGRIDKLGGDYKEILRYALGEGRVSTVNLRVQATRILGENAVVAAIPELISLLDDKEARVRHAAIGSLAKTGFGENTVAVLKAVSDETDRITFYTSWQVLQRLLSTEARRELLSDDRAGIRMMAALSLMEERRATADDMFLLQDDADTQLRDLVRAWQKKTGNGEELWNVSVKVRERAFRDKTQVSFSVKKGADLRVTRDGSTPTVKSPRYTAPIEVRTSVELKVAAFVKGRLSSEIQTVALHKISDAEWKDRLFAFDAAVKSSHPWEIENDGLQRGVKAYTDASTTITEIPEEVAGSSMIRLSSRDGGQKAADFIAFKINIPAMVYVAYDARYPVPKWMAGFTPLSASLKTSLSKKKGGVMTVYGKRFEPGKVSLGGPSHEKSKGAVMYQVFLSMVSDGKTTATASQAALAKTDLKHGEELFFGRGTCFACHQVGGKGIVLGPDLNEIAKLRDVNYVIDSIINPSSYIVEGFQQTSLEMKDGSTLFGMVQESTAQSVTLYLPTGKKVVVRTKEIKKRNDAKLSGMPASFAHTLSAQDVADISAWLIDRSGRK